MASDAHINVDLNAASDTFGDDVEEFDPRHNRPARGRDKAKRLQRHGANMDAKAKHRETIVKNMEAQTAAIQEKKEIRLRQEKRHEELVAQQQKLGEQQEVINHLTIIRQGDLKPEDEELIEEAKHPSRSWLKKFFKK